MMSGRKGRMGSPPDKHCEVVPDFLKNGASAVLVNADFDRGSEFTGYSVSNSHCFRKKISYYSCNYSIQFNFRLFLQCL